MRAFCPLNFASFNFGVLKYVPLIVPSRCQLRLEYTYVYIHQAMHQAWWASI
jgi:hypothetical protein